MFGDVSGTRFHLLEDREAIITRPEGSARAYPQNGGSGVSSRTPDFYDRSAAEAAWVSCARSIAGRPAARTVVRRDGRPQYPADRQHLLTETLPKTPTAVMLFNQDEHLSLLALDFDAKGHTEFAAAADAQDALELLGSVGLSPVADVAPTGGWHVYARLPRPAPKRAVRQLAAALRARWATLDISPLCNPIHGCIRPPGAPHTAGGFQALVTPIDQVTKALGSRPDPGSWNRLRHAVGAQQYEAAAEVAQEVDGSPAVGIRYRGVPRSADQLARTGHHPTKQFRSPSEARFSVIMSCVRCGWSLADIRNQLPHWEWFRQSLGTKHHSSLAGDFHRAKKRRTQDLQDRHVHQPNTSQQQPQGGLYPSDNQTELPTPTVTTEDPHLDLRKFRAFTTDHRCRRHYSPRLRATLDAVIQFGYMKSRLYVDVGVRSLAEAANNRFETVSVHLHSLAADGLITRVSDAQGVLPDVWRVNTELGDSYRPASGQQNAIRPLFRVLGGHLTAEVYEQLATRRGRSPVRCVQLASTLGYDPRTIRDALSLLESWGLCERDGQAYEVGSTDPTTLSKRLGGHEHQKTQHDEHATQRQQWAQRLGQQPHINPEQIDWDAEFAAIEPENDWIKDHASGSPPAGREFISVS
jgi:DNA-binding HxlR family transcriptional regulator